MNAVDYWKTRCELAEKYIEETPCDPDIYEEQIVAYNSWGEFKNLPIPDVSNSALLQELTEKIHSMKKFADEHYKQLAKESANTVFSSIKRWIAEKVI